MYMETQRDPVLWEIARRRASFKYHLVIYLVFIAFFWIVWALDDGHSRISHGWPWPIWPMLGWGIGLLFHFLGAYVFPKDTTAEREYQKLVKAKHETL